METIITALLHLDCELLLFFNGGNSVLIDVLMQALTSGLTWIPLYLALFYLVIRSNKSVGRIVAIVICAALCVTLAGGVADCFVKPLVMRCRPLNDPALSHVVRVIAGTSNDSYSFFSSHAANTFSIALFFFLITQNRLLGTTLIFWSLLNCYTRVYLAMHYPSDVLAGLAWGTVVALLVYAVYSRTNKTITLHDTAENKSSVPPTYKSSDAAVVFVVFLLTLLYALIRAVITCS